MRLVDVTQPLSPRTPRSSDHPEVQFPVVRWYSRHGVKTRQIIASLHAGTHVDAPCLYDPAGVTVDQLPLERLCGPAVVVDAALPAWGVIDAAFLEARASMVQEGDIVVLCTGWSRYYDSDEETYILRSPGLSKSGVDWLASRQVKAVCSDSPSPEHIFMRIRQWRALRPDVFDGVQIDPAEFPPSYAHKTFLSRGIALIEGLSGAISDFVGQRVILMALPAKYEGVEGAPARVVIVTEFP